MSDFESDFKSNRMSHQIHDESQDAEEYEDQDQNEEYEDEEGEEEEDEDQQDGDDQLYEHYHKGAQNYSSAEVNNEEQQGGNQALNLRWTMGFNYKMVNGAINLTREKENPRSGEDNTIQEIFYCVGHTGVIYNYSEKKSDNRQRLLQGHCNQIKSVAYSHSKGVIITADKGPNSLLVVWDVNSGTPKRCIFDPHPNGVKYLDVTADGSIIVTISREKKDSVSKHIVQQTVCLWRWEEDSNQLIATGVIQSDPPGNPIDYQRFVQFNYTNSEEFANGSVSSLEFVTTGRSSVHFWKMENDGTCTSYSPPTSSKVSSSDGKHNKHFTQTVFIPKSTQAVSGTADGNLVVWDISLIMEEMSQPDQKREIKIINLMNQNGRSQNETAGISLLKASEVLLIVGATNGNVRFYDYQFRIVGWFEEETGLAEVTSISLSNVKFEYENVLNDLNKDEYDFKYPDFIVGDKKAKILMLNTDLFKGVTDTSKKKEVLVQSMISPVLSISSKPKSSNIAIACKDGSIYEWSYMTPTKLDLLRNMKQFSATEEPTTLKYSPNGKFLVVTSNCRNVYVYNTSKKEWQSSPLMISSKKEYPHAVELSFSYDSKFFAIVDTQSCASLYRLDEEERIKSKDKPDKFEEDWVFFGKIKSHLSEINDVCFGEILNPANSSEKISKFYSIGNDKMLFQYDANNQLKNKLDVTSSYKIETESRPTACIWYPVNYLKEEIIMVATDDYKIKLWNVTKNICRQTLLGPTYGGPINRFVYLNINEREEQDIPKYVAYSTKEKIVGIIKLPLDGNPNKHMGMIAHPSKISCATASSDGKYLFTSGADSIGTLNMWRINYSALEAQETNFGSQPQETFTNSSSPTKQNQKKTSNPLDTYPNLLEGGKTGQMYRDLKNFFYYAQISSNTDNPTKAKKLDGKIPRDQIQNLMRALGYYPTKLEIENMQKEVMYSKLLEGGELQESLELETFVRMFINHRPVYGLTTDMIENALKFLVSDTNKIQAHLAVNEKGKKEKNVTEHQEEEPKGLTRAEFIRLLTSEGERMDHEELDASLKVLLGEGSIDEILPDIIDNEFLIEKLLGFELDDIAAHESAEENLDAVDEEDIDE